MAARRLARSSLVILAGTLLVLVGSFLPFYEAGPSHINAWDYLSPVTVLPVVFGALMTAHVGLSTWGDLRLPPTVGGFTWNQIHLALGFQSAVLMVAWLLRDRGPVDFGLGFWLMLVGSIALAVGAYMRTRESARRL